MTLLLSSTRGDSLPAYYLVGYAVECALKACIAAQTKQYEFPNKQRVLDSYTHNLEKLVGVAGLDERVMEADPELAVNWAYAKDWTEERRYEQRSEQEAQDLFGAVADPDHGVLTMLRAYW